MSLKILWWCLVAPNMFWKVNIVFIRHFLLIYQFQILWNSWILSVSEKKDSSRNKEISFYVTNLVFSIFQRIYAWIPCNSWSLSLFFFFGTLNNCIKYTWLIWSFKKKLKFSISIAVAWKGHKLIFFGNG